MTTNGCGNGCTAGQYVCPSDHRTCVDSAADYAKCPGMTGTHLDASLGVEQRLDFLVNHTTLEEQIAQLTNTAPEIARLGIPSYQWLNDDQHGVARTPARATVFPNGAGLGATGSATTLHEVGRVVGTEARGLHRGFLDADPSRSMGCNGCSLTMYAPNLNLVRDPRWGRAQVSLCLLHLMLLCHPTHTARVHILLVLTLQPALRSICVHTPVCILLHVVTPCRKCSAKIRLTCRDWSWVWSRAPKTTVPGVVSDLTVAICWLAHAVSILRRTTWKVARARQTASHSTQS